MSACFLDCDTHDVRRVCSVVHACLADFWRLEDQVALKPHVDDLTLEAPSTYRLKAKRTSWGRYCEFVVEVRRHGMKCVRVLVERRRHDLLFFHNCRLVIRVRLVQEGLLTSLHAVGPPTTPLPTTLPSLAVPSSSASDVHSWLLELLRGARLDLTEEAAIVACGLFETQRDSLPLATAMAMVCAMLDPQKGLEVLRMGLVCLHAMRGLLVRFPRALAGALDVAEVAMRGDDSYRTANLRAHLELCAAWRDAASEDLVAS